MKKIIIGIVAAVALVGSLGVIVAVADPVTPATLTLRCYRNSGSSGNITNITYWQGNTLSFTGSVMYANADGSVTQNLDGCSIDISAGSLSTTNPATAVGSAIDTNAGTWTAEITLPAANPCYIEVTVSNQAVFTYPRYRIATQARLGE